MPDTPPPSPQPNPYSMPSEIGGFVIQRVLGAGGMATVYAALQKQPRRIVALKVIKPGVTTETALRRFKREVEILGKLRHPYIAQVFAAGTHHDPSGVEIPYFVMEYVPGARTLLEHVSMHNLELRERLKLFVKVCAAVEHGHRAKVIHRDLKPGNILIDENGEPKIIDFGVAHTTELELNPGAAGAVSMQTMHTEPGRLVGTLHYMSPEQVDTTRHDLDPRCDVYALGVVLYKLTTGHLPLDLEAVPIYEAARMIREKIPRPPSEVNPTVKGDLETIILKALEKDRTRRYSNAGSLGRDIVRYLAGKPIHGRRAGAVYHTALFVKRHRAAILTSLIVLAALAGAAGYVLWNQARLDEQRRQMLAAADQQARVAPSPIDSPTQPVEIADQTKSFVLHGHNSAVVGMAFSPDGRTLVSSSADRTIIVWNLSIRAAIHTLYSEGGPASWLRFTADSNQILIASDSGGNLGMIDIATGKTRHTRVSGCGRVLALGTDAAGERAAVACDDLTLRVITLRDGATSTLRGTTGAFTSCAFSPDGTMLAAGSQRDTVYLWKFPTAGGSPTLLYQSSDLRGEIAALAFSSDANRLTAVADDGNAMMWRLNAAAGDAQDSAAPFVASTGGGLLNIAFAPNGDRFACRSRTSLTLWDLSIMPPKPLARPISLSDQPTAVGIDSEGKWWAAAGAEGDIRITSVHDVRNQ